MKSLSVLLIEDDQIETIKFKRVIAAFEEKHRVIEAQNGEEALQYLASDQELPDVILLDLNMPKMNGIEFLKTLKAHPEMKYIPVVILTTSNNHKDVLESYTAGVAGYILKPLRYEAYKTKIQVLIEYWMHNEFFKP